MKTRARDGSRLLAQYREQTGLHGEDRARVLRRLQQRLADGERPNPQLHAAPPELPRAAGPLARARVGMLAGVLVLAGGYALFRVAEPQPPQPSATGVSGASARPAPADVSEPFATAAPAPPPPESSVAIEVADVRAPSAQAREPEATRPLRVEPVRSLRKPTAAVGAGLQTGTIEPTPTSLPPEPPVEAPGDASPEEPARTIGPMRSAAIAPSPVPERSAAQPSTDSLAQEMQVMEAAHAALRRGDARRALALLAEHSWRYPTGHLAEAREVARILALCQLGRIDQAQAQTQTFLSARPSSPFAARLRVGCAGASPTSEARDP